MFAPEVTREQGGWQIRLAVLEGAGLLQHWKLSIPAHGAASFDRHTVARDLDVGNLGGP